MDGGGSNGEVMTERKEMERFTAWLSVAERNALRSRAREFGTSENYVVRMILRQGLGLERPASPAIRTAERTDRV